MPVRDVHRLAFLIDGRMAIVGNVCVPGAQFTNQDTRKERVKEWHHHISLQIFAKRRRR
jgi:hypothetical protein